MRILCSLLVPVFLMVPATAQTASKPKAKTRTAVVTAQDLQALRDALAAQTSALAPSSNSSQSCERYDREGDKA
jgi:hypothetical protein